MKTLYFIFALVDPIQKLKLLLIRIWIHKPAVNTTLVPENPSPPYFKNNITSIWPDKKRESPPEESLLAQDREREIAKQDPRVVARIQDGGRAGPRTPQTLWDGQARGRA